MSNRLASFFLPCFCACFFGFVFVAFAQTTATVGEQVVGKTGCTYGNTTADFDTLAQCTSTTSSSGTMQKAPLFMGSVTVPPYATASCDSAKSGLLQYSATYGFSKCDGTAWASVQQPYVLTAGTLMPDGTIYAGGGMYTTPCDIGMAGTQASCTGTRTSGTIYTQIAYCKSLDAYGHKDWFLPAWDGLTTLYANSAAIGGFDLAGSYYLSMNIVYSATSFFYETVIPFNSGPTGTTITPGTNTFPARCVRK